jgi:very-short-patch-repair endonuclease
MKAAQQHGLVTRKQLKDLGFGKGAIDHRVATGSLLVVRPGVYAVGHRELRPRAFVLAAVLSMGPDAVASHVAAAAIHGIRPSAATKVDVTVPRSRRGGKGIRPHHAALPPDHVEEVDGIPVTTVERTIVDLAAVLRPEALRRAMEEAEGLRLTDWRVLEELVAEARGHRGIRALRAIIAERSVGTRVTKRELEASFLDLLRRHRIPLPDTNVHIEGFEVDCVWRRERLIVELDSHRHHGTAAAFERDRRRDRALAVAGWRTTRITWRQLRDHELPRDLARLLRTP